VRFDVLTLFPGMFPPVLGESVIGRAIDAGLVELNLVDIRDFSRDKHRKTDDYAYGGGTGLVMTPQPVYDAWLSLQADGAPAGGAPSNGRRPRTVYLSPQGKPFTQQKAIELAREPRLILLCGHYEGVDERVLELIVDEEISIGDYVLTGGEIPAMALIDSVSRLVPGVLPNEDAYTEESHYRGVLEYPQYTRPEVFMGKAVPEVLLSGHHKNIEAWRREQSAERTRERRPDIAPPVPKERRRLLLDRAGNVRELGGYPTKGGGVTRWRTFLRADIPLRLTGEDRAFLLAYGLTTVIDLRSREEAVRKPNAFCDDDRVQYCLCPLIAEDRMVRLITEGKFSDLYLAIADEGMEGVAAAFRILAETRGARMFHCTVGKDRTGVLAALLLAVCDVPFEDILADYQVSYTHNRARFGGIDYAKQGPGGMPWGYELNSDPANIERFLTHLNAKHGGARAYLEAAGVGEDVLMRIRADFVEA